MLEIYFFIKGTYLGEINQSRFVLTYELELGRVICFLSSARLISFFLLINLYKFLSFFKCFEKTLIEPKLSSSSSSSVQHEINTYKFTKLDEPKRVSHTRLKLGLDN